MQILFYSLVFNNEKEKVMMEMVLHLTYKNHTNKMQMTALLNFDGLYMLQNKLSEITTVGKKFQCYY